MDKVELEEITFSNKNENDPNFPNGYNPINATNLNKIQENTNNALSQIQDNMLFFATEEEWEE